MYCRNLQDTEFLTYMSSVHFLYVFADLLFDLFRGNFCRYRGRRMNLGWAPAKYLEGLASHTGLGHT